MKSIMEIKKVVIPVAGKGTRFLPVTKQIPKEMIPIVNKPMIHYVVDEVIQSGINKIIFIISQGKEVIENYFDRNFNLEMFLSKNNKKDICNDIKKIGNLIDIVSIRQKKQLGLGHAILCVKDLINNEPFAVLLGDDLIINDKPAIKQLMETYTKNNISNLLGVMSVTKEEVSKYGVVDFNKNEASSKTFKIKGVVEKPISSKAPSNLIIPGRYIFDNKIFYYLEKVKKDSNNEYQLTDAINFMSRDEKVFAHEIKGIRYDTGNMKGYLEATVDFAIREEKTKGIMNDIINKYKV